MILVRAGCGPPALSNSAFIKKPSGTLALAGMVDQSSGQTQLLQLLEVSLFACLSRRLWHGLEHPVATRELGMP
jgi:hypothetical protein